MFLNKNHGCGGDKEEEDASLSPECSGFQSGNVLNLLTEITPSRKGSLTE